MPNTRSSIRHRQVGSSRRAPWFLAHLLVLVPVPALALVVTWQAVEPGEVAQSLRCDSKDTLRDLSLVDAQGAVVYAGCRLLDSSRRQAHVVKLNANGARQWSATLLGQETDESKSTDLDIDENGDIHVAFLARTAVGSNQTWVTLSGESGQEIRRQVLASSASYSASARLSLQSDLAGSLYASWHELNALGESETVLRRFDLSSGAAVWTTRTTRPNGGSESLNLVGLDATGNPVVGGVYQPKPVTTSVGYVRVHVRDSGDVLWERDFAGWIGVADATVHPSGDLLLGRGGMRVSRHTPSGAMVWESEPIDPLEYGGWLYELDVDQEGDIYVAGRSIRSGSPLNGAPVFAKFSGADGGLFWVAHHDEGAYTLVGERTSLATTRTGVVRVAFYGSSQSFITDRDSQTGGRVAEHPMGGTGRAIRIHGAGADSYRLLDDLVTDDGIRRVRVRRLEDFESLFHTDFEPTAP